ncbi:hypothetical protein [Azospirillum doebereinerae]
MRVMILGSSGFTGRHVRTLCERDETLEFVDSRSLGLDLMSADSILSALSACRPDVVINLAAISSPAEKDYRSLYEINAFGVQRLVDALKATGFAGRLIQASTANVYGSRTEWVSRESDPVDPVNHYACSKWLAERVCGMAEGGFSIVLTRPFSCIGLGQAEHFLLPKIVRHFRERAPRLELGALDIRRDFVDIRDAAAVYHALITRSAVPDLVHICRNQTASIQEILDTLAEIAGFRPEIAINPAFSRPNDLRFQQGDDTRLRRFGMSCTRTLHNTLAWMYAGDRSE